MKLSSALSSLARVKSARLILDALADGERDPRVLAGLAAGQVKAGRAGIEQALEGMRYGDHHGRLTRIHLDHITFLNRSVAAVEDDIAACLDAIPAAQGIGASGARSPDPGPGAAVLPAAQRLAEIPGVSLDLARAIIAETGLDMTRFPTADCLVSWAGLTPVASPAPAAASPERATATPTCAATAPRPPPAPRRPAPSSANGSAACHGASAAAGPGAPSDAPSSSSSGTSSPIPRPLHRPRPRLARPQDRHRPQDPQPPEPAPPPPPRQRHHHHLRRLNPKTP